MRNYLVGLCLAFLCATAHADLSDYSFKFFVGDQMKEVLPFLINSRLTAFREYPYLYDGTVEEETEWCNDFMGYTDAALAVAYYEDKPIGIASGASLVDFATHFGNPDGFKAANYDLKKIYYFAEAIIEPEHRGRGLIKMLAQHFEAWVIEQGYTHGCFVVESHDIHPLKPLKYKEHDSLWRAFEFEKTNITVQMDWLTLQPDGSSQQQNHILTYWVKTFRP